MKCPIDVSLHRLILAGTTLLCWSAAYAQQDSPRTDDHLDAIEEILVIVDRDGNPVDIDSLRYEADMLKAIREFAIEQHKQEEELWRQRLRSFMKSKSSRITWGYDAQSEAARFRYSQANYLPMDRLQPATFVSIRF